MKRKDEPRNNPDWPPFPLPDIYDDDDPHLVNAAYAAIRTFRRNYVPEIGLNGEQLKAATEVALDIRRAWSNEGLELREVPLAKNPGWPTEQDFIRLEQWFLDAQTAIAKKIASGSETAAMQPPAPAAFGRRIAQWLWIGLKAGYALTVESAFKGIWDRVTNRP